MLQEVHIFLPLWPVGYVSLVLGHNHTHNGLRKNKTKDTGNPCRELFG